MASTNTTGEFRFTADPGRHRVTETDPAGYTSSTVNSLDVDVVVHQTVEVTFGDITQQDVQFQEITLGNTQNALSLATIDTNEDNKADLDLILGTHYVGGSNDILVWWNGRVSASTPNSSIFSTTPSYQRVVSTDVNALVAADLNADGYGDITTGLGATTNNLNVWIMQSSGSNKGKLPTTATANYTATGATGVYDLAMGKCDTNAYPDLIVGSYSSSMAGAVEIWHGASGGSTFTRATRDLFVTLPGTSTAVGAVRAVAVADFNGDGYTDIVAGAQTATNASKVYLLLYSAGTLYDYALQATIPVTGIVQDVRALDMKEDASGDVDILIATALSTTAGEVQVWHNRGDNTFGEGDTPSQMMSDSANPGGVPLSLSTASVDNDVFPDLIVGTRTTSFAGQVVLYRGYGFLPTNGTVISTTSVGEVITSTIGDFNKDGAPDLAIGTRTASSTGKVVVYFNVRPAS